MCFILWRPENAISDLWLGRKKSNKRIPSPYLHILLKAQKEKNIREKKHLKAIFAGALFFFFLGLVGLFSSVSVSLSVHHAVEECEIGWPPSVTQVPGF